jgi:ribonuclease P/MRP protein subunit RPP40
MEHSLRGVMLDHFLDGNLLDQSQHGFMFGKSCATNLIESLDIITFALGSGDEVDEILLDFSKAFDKVVHRFLITKVRAYGFAEQKIVWIQDFLSVDSRESL